MDFDGDGRSDIISGCWDGDVRFFKRKEDGTFAKSIKVRDVDDNFLDVGSASVSFAHDWDGDGDLDLLIGEIKGGVHLSINEGTSAKPAFAKPKLIEADGQAIQVPGGDSGAAVADWDGDGNHDLLVGAGDGSVLFYRNLGDNKQPRLAAATTLVPAKMNMRPQPPDEGVALKDDRPWGMRLKICVTDYNGDGRLDLLAGDFNTQPAAPPEPKELTEEEAAQLKKLSVMLSALRSKYQRIAIARGSETPAEREARQQQSKAYLNAITEVQSRIDAIQPAMRVGGGEMHGFVWLFLRKPAKAAALP